MVNLMSIEKVVDLQTHNHALDLITRFMNFSSQKRDNQKIITHNQKVSQKNIFHVFLTPYQISFKGKEVH